MAGNLSQAQQQLYMQQLQQQQAAAAAMLAQQQPQQTPVSGQSAFVPISLPLCASLPPYPTEVGGTGSHTCSHADFNHTNYAADSLPLPSAPPPARPQQQRGIQTKVEEFWQETLETVKEPVPSSIPPRPIPSLPRPPRIRVGHPPSGFYGLTLTHPHASTHSHIHAPPCALTHPRASTRTHSLQYIPR